MFFGLYETLALLIQGAYLMHEGLTPTSEKPKISFSCGLDIMWRQKRCVKPIAGVAASE